jgi:hypothetical protein
MVHTTSSMVTLRFTGTRMAEPIGEWAFLTEAPAPEEVQRE